MTHVKLRDTPHFRRAVPGARLTAREIEVRDLLTIGQVTKEIALQLHISPRTVETHRRCVIVKYGVRNVVELTRMVVEAERQI